VLNQLGGEARQPDRRTVNEEWAAAVAAERERKLYEVAARLVSCPESRITSVCVYGEFGAYHVERDRHVAAERSTKPTGNRWESAVAVVGRVVKGRVKKT